MKKTKAHVSHKRDRGIRLFRYPQKGAVPTDHNNNVLLSLRKFIQTINTSYFEPCINRFILYAARLGSSTFFIDY